MVKPQNEIFKTVLLDLATREVEQWDALPDAPFCLSEKFELKIKKLIKAQSHWTWSLVKSTKRKVTTALLVAMLLFVLSLGISAVRKPVFTFFFEVHEKTTTFYTKKIFSSKDDIATIEKEYTLEWVADRYELKERIDYGVAINTVWAYGEKEITFDQSVAAGGIWDIDNEVDVYSKFVKGNIEYHYILKCKTYCFFWTDGVYVFMLTLPEEIGLETCKIIVDSCVEVQ